MQEFCPAPLTLILNQRSDSPIVKEATAGLDSVAVRIPNHPFALELLRQLGQPIASPSANMSGSLSPTRVEHCWEFAEMGVVVFDGGHCRLGIESTIIDVRGDDARVCILREGAVSGEDLAGVLPFEVVRGGVDLGVSISPGQLLSHYSPVLPLFMGVSEVVEGVAHLAFGEPDNGYLNLSRGGDVVEAGRNLFAYLHLCDLGGFEGISVAPIPDIGIGRAINERLRKAAFKNL